MVAMVGKMFCKADKASAHGRENVAIYILCKFIEKIQKILIVNKKGFKL